MEIICIYIKGDARASCKGGLEIQRSPSGRGTAAKADRMRVDVVDKIIRNHEYMQVEGVTRGSRLHIRAQTNYSRESPPQALADSLPPG